MAYVLSFVAATRETSVEDIVEAVKKRLEAEDRKKEKARERARAYYPKYRERKSLIGREYYKNLSPEKRERKRLLTRGYYQNLSPEKKEERKRIMREYQRNLTRKKREARRKNAYENCDRVNTRKTRRKASHCKCYEHETVENSKTSASSDTKRQVFCYTCRMQFSNNSALLEHIAVHVTSPSVVVSRIDEHRKVLCAIKHDSENIQINSNSDNGISQNVTHIKTERVEYDEDIEHLLNIHEKTKTDTEIHIDSV